MKRFSVFFLTFLLFCTPFYAELPHGAALCDAVRAVCEKTGIKPQRLPLVPEGSNRFPANLYIQFSGHYTGKLDSEENKKSLLIVLRQEEIYRNPVVLQTLLDKLSAEKPFLDTGILLSYGDFSVPGNFSPVPGSIYFLNQKEDPANQIVLLVSMEEDHTSIIPGCGGHTNPSWFIRDIYSAYRKNGILEGPDFGYTSGLFRLNIYNYPVQDAFLERGVSAVTANFEKGLDTESIAGSIFCFARDCNPFSEAFPGTHAFMFSLFGHEIWFSENVITKTILASLFIVLTILYIYGFINKQFRLVAWKKMKKIWFYPFIVYAGTILLFYFFVFLMGLFVKKWTVPFSAAAGFFLPLQFIGTSLFFINSLKFNPEFKKRTVSYLYMVTSSINLIIFTLLDISLFPIFLFEFFLALLSTSVKQIWFQLLVLVFCILPYIAPLRQFLFHTTQNEVITFFTTRNLVPFFIFLVILPINILCFRIITGLNFHWYKKGGRNFDRQTRNLIIIISGTVIFELFISILLPSSFKHIEKTENERIVVASRKTENLSMKSTSSSIFGETVKTIKIKSLADIDHLDVRISGSGENPVLFSDYSFRVENHNTAVFEIPYQPPRNMEFSWGQKDKNAKITVTAFYRNGNNLFMERVEEGR